MKTTLFYYLLFFLIANGCLLGCKGGKKVQDTPNNTHTNKPNPELVDNPITLSDLGDLSVRTINLITDIDGSNIKATINRLDTTLNELKTPTDGKFLYLGILNFSFKSQPPSCLKLQSFNVPMTDISMMEAQSPKPIVIPTGQLNKLAIVEGFYGGGMLYGCRIVGVFDKTPLELLYQLLDEGELKLDPYLKILGEE